MDASAIDRVLVELAEVPVEPGDPELAALALAVHLELALGVTVPADQLDAEHLVPPAARERTVRRLLGDA
ncbi:hypothetical protein [Nocardioides flavus (ex Wang et al. 2016)]|uniref:hypothetical protein n=1 Tax=Nocardioides flavus (ex Wang et al. 2016) TaxID=2058780 RepID=UPI00174D3FB6|nr:hypothetical protein [Nocardioides flavus (ex Wang et al. 2016)]